MKDKKEILEKMEGFELMIRDIVYEVYRQGKLDGIGEAKHISQITESSEWLKKQIDDARAGGYENGHKEGLKEGQRVAIASFEGSNKKLYEG